MKRKTTKEILAESFRELAADYPVDKITIQKIVDNCDYSPATFYRHFKDKYDLIAWDYVYHTSKIMDKVGSGGYEWKDTLTDGMKYFLDNKEYIQNLLQNTGGHDAFFHYFSEANIRHLTKCVKKHLGQEKFDRDVELLIRIYCLGTVEITCQWLLDEIKCESANLIELYEKALPPMLRDILCK